MKEAYVGVDIGGTSMRVVAFESLADTGPASRVLVNHSGANRSYEDDYKLLVDTIKGMEADTILGIGLGLPGRISPDKSHVVRTAHLPHWQNKLVTEALSKDFDCPVKLDHDQVCSALGEVVYGGTTDRGFSLIGYGTGIGGAFVESTGTAQIVHAIQRDQENDYFEQWEEECGGAQIAKEFSKPACELNEGEWATVMARFQRQLEKYLSRPEVNSDTVVFSGGIAVKQATRLQAVFGKIKMQAPTFADTHFEFVQHGEYSGAMGAVALLQQSGPTLK